jgi:hypothetical protein
MHRVIVIAEGAQADAAEKAKAPGCRTGSACRRLPLPRSERTAAANPLI